MSEDTSVQLTLALVRVWTSIRRRHPEVPGVMILAAPAQKGHMNVLGHFAALRWKAKRDGGRMLHEVVVVAEHLNRSAADVVETLVHEAAHALNFARSIKDCTRSQYHNQHFKRAAEELGLKVEQTRHYGWALTTLRPETLDQYASEVAHLEGVLVHRAGLRLLRISGNAPDAVPGCDNDKGSESRSRKAVCACPFIIRVAKKTLEDTTIRCENCGGSFHFA